MRNYTMKNMKSIFGVIFTTLVMIGCTDKTTVVQGPVNVPDSVTSSYYPLEDGNTYLYRSVILDSANVERSGSIRFDSVYIAKVGKYLDKDAFTETGFREGNTLGTTYVSKVQNAAYRYMSAFILDSALPIVIKPRWIKEADFNSNIPSWITADTSITNVPVRFGTQNGVDSGTVTARIVQTRTKSGSVAVSFGTPSKTVQAIEITSTTNFKGNVISAGAAASAVPIEFNNVEKIYYADSIGVVKRHRDFYKIEASFISRLVPGFDYTLQAYTKK